MLGPLKKKIKNKWFLTKDQCQYQESLNGDFPGGPVATTLALNAGGPGSISGRGTRSHMPQLIVHMLQLKIQSAATKTNQINKQKRLRPVVVWGLPWRLSSKEAAYSAGAVVQSLSCI